MCGGGYALPNSSQIIPGYALVRSEPLAFYWAKAAPRAEPKNVKASQRRGVATAAHQAAEPKRE
jgi:hypothetical protein